MQTANISGAPAVASWATLYAQWVEGSGDAVPLARSTIHIGRKPENDIIIDHPAISGQHLEIGYEQGSAYACDLNSRNGTYINGLRLPANQRVPIGPGTVIRIHNCIDLRLATADAQCPPGGMPAHVRFAARPQPGIIIGQVGGCWQRYFLSDRRLNIGRRPENDIIINSSVVSGRHAEITPLGEGHYGITDQGSTNGLVHNGRRIKSKPLRPGDTLWISDQVVLQFQSSMCFYTSEDRQPEAHRTETQLLNLAAEKTIRIGRAEDNNIRIDDNRVSRHHAIIERIGMRYRIRDLRSDNGTFVNDKPVEKEQFIAEGDSIRIGGTRFKFEEDGLEQMDASAGLRVDLLRLNKFVDKKKNLLQDISLSIYPREFVALVGTSGAGKSTLLDAMNGFRPATHGKVLINGVDLYHHFDAFRSELGYVPQDDIMHRELTVQQALEYAARLRMPADTSAAERRKRVEQVLTELGLEPRRDLPIHKLSGGQRKRVSIGVELLTRPRLFFLDEATSGLDPGTELELMNLLRQLTEDPHEGRTIILITHATKNVMLCDKVIFLTRGGYLAFFGPPDEALRYFEQYRSKEERDLKPDFEFDDIYNLIDPDKKLGEGATEKEKLALAAEWAQRYRQSPAYQKYVVERLADRQHGRQAGLEASATRIRTAPRTSNWRQFGILTSRSLAVMRGDWKSLAVLLLQAPLIGATSVINMGKDIFNATNGHGGNQGDAIQTLFLAVIIVLLFGAVNGAREITKEIPVYKRERMVNLKILPYVSSKALVGGLFCLYQVAIYLAFTAITIDWPSKTMGLSGWGQLYLTLALCSISGIMLGLVLSALASNDGQAVALIPVILIPQFIFAGAMMPELGNTPVVPAISSSRWALAALSSITGVQDLPLSKDSDKIVQAMRNQGISDEVERIVAQRLDSETKKALDEQVAAQTNREVANQKEKAQLAAENETRKKLDDVQMSSAQKEQQVAAARQQAAQNVDAKRPDIERSVRESIDVGQVRTSVEANLRSKVLEEATKNAPEDSGLAGQYDKLFQVSKPAAWFAMSCILAALFGIILLLQKRKDVV